MAEVPAPSPSRLREQQLSLTRHLRDPDAVAGPAGVEDRRLGVYRELVFNNLRSLLGSNFPVIRQLLGPERWSALVRDFLREHRAHTPLFPELPREMLQFLQTRADAGADDPAFLPELAHYEWLELALQLSDAALPPHDPDGDLATGIPVLSPLAWPAAYTWPVHRIGPDYQPTQAPTEPTLLLLRRQPDGQVRFAELGMLAYALLQRWHDDDAAATGVQALHELAIASGTADVAELTRQGLALLEQMRTAGVILGTRLR